MGEQIKCIVWGDPHIVTFDLYRLFGSSWNANKWWRKDNDGGDWVVGNYFIPSVLRSGDYWLVKSQRIHIQARYGTEEQDLWPLRSVGIAGEFLGGHALTVEKMWEGSGEITWDGQQVRDPGSFDFGGLARVHATRDSRGHFVTATVHLPDHVFIELRRYTWSHLDSATVSCTVLMHKQADRQIGHCGQADGDLRDDTTAYLSPGWRGRVPRGEVLFQETASFLQAAAGRSTGGRQAARAAAAAPCDEDASREHEGACVAAFEAAGLGPDVAGPLLRSCAFDVCSAGGDAGAAKGALAAAQDMDAFRKSCADCAAPPGRAIRWATHPTMCLDIGGGKPMNGSRVDIWKCSEGQENQQFLLPPGGSGPIRWAKHPHMCLDVSGGKAGNGARVQIWQCNIGHPHMQFDLPSERQGKIRWSEKADLCLDVKFGRAQSGTPVQLWECMEEGHPNKEFLFDFE